MARKQKQELLRKRQELDGGAAARRALANQKATVKVVSIFLLFCLKDFQIKIGDTGDRTKEKPAPTSKRLRDEFDSDKVRCSVCSKISLISADS